MSGTRRTGRGRRTRAGEGMTGKDVRWLDHQSLPYEEMATHANPAEHPRAAAAAAKRERRAQRNIRNARQMGL